jgi:putative colanic acid biosynthesis glycosyltransferase WcaI
VRFLLLNQFYPPDAAPTGVYLHDVARGLVAAGHEVRVLASRRGYDGGGPFAARETMDGVDVRRLPTAPFGYGAVWRGASHLSYLALALPRAVAGGWAEHVVTLTSPPYVGVLGALAARLRAATHVHWAMDLYPDVLDAHGMGGWVQGPLRALARWQMRATRLVLTPSADMAERLRARAGTNTAVADVPLWTRPHERAANLGALRQAFGWPAHALVLLYSGNLGLGHRFDEFLAAARRLGPDGPLWVFAGGGARRGEIEAAASDAPVRLLAYADPAEHRARALAADVHLLSLRTSWDGLIVPSKLQAAFGAGRPVIFVGNRRGDIGRWIAESGGGWTVDEGDTDGLLRAVAEAGDPEERRKRGDAALAFALERFGPERNVGRMVELIVRARG